MAKLETIIGVKNASLVAQGLTGDDQPFYRCDFAEVLPLVADGIVLGQREALESDESVRQFLPYTVLGKEENGEAKVFVYRRGKGVGESRLSGNVSIGIGGHIDLVDVVHENSVINPIGTILQSMSRELAEEIVLENAGSDLRLGSMGVLLDNSNAVGRVHVGLVILASLPPEADAACREEELETLGFMTPQELLDSGLPLENWTKILCEQFVAEGH